MSTSHQHRPPASGDGTAPRGVYVHTFGCQMNVYDTERLLQGLEAEGYRPVEDPEAADLVLFNTCSVRDKAEQKLLSELGRLRPRKEERPELLVGVAGCVAQQEREGLARKVPWLDMVFGPDAVPRVGEIVRRARERVGRVVETRFEATGGYAFPRAEPRPGSVGATAFVTIQKGCDKVCTYCIVPFTRGREVSRPYGEVVDEVRRFVEAGAREVTLIGQNVNCYHGGATFSELLHRVAEVPGLRRLRYTTSYPREMGEDVFEAHRDIPVLARHLHLPVQSGSDRILKLMRREHTAEAYLEKVRRLREVVPDIALTTDIIVGFPGETDADFAATMELVEAVRFDTMYSFIFSERPGTWASRHGDELGFVPRETATARLERLQTRQREISLERTRRFIGSRVEVLVEGPSKKDPARRQGHSTHNWMVHFPANAEAAPAGALVEVEVREASHFGLTGSLAGMVDSARGSSGRHVA